MYSIAIFHIAHVYHHFLDVYHWSTFRFPHIQHLSQRETSMQMSAVIKMHACVCHTCTQTHMRAPCSIWQTRTSNAVWLLSLGSSFCSAGWAVLHAEAQAGNPSILRPRLLFIHPCFLFLFLFLSSFYFFNNSHTFRSRIKPGFTPAAITRSPKKMRVPHQAVANKMWHGVSE